MLSEMDKRQAWKPWLRQSFTKSPRSPRPNHYENSSGKLLLFVRVVHNDKSDVYTLRDLQNGIKIYEIKAELELLSGIPTNMMEIYALPERSYNDEDSLSIGKNVSFGDTVRVHLNKLWNGLYHSAWKGTVSDVKRFLSMAQKQLGSPVGLLNSDHEMYRDKDQHNLLSTTLFIASRRGQEDICKLLLKKGASGTYTTSLGNSCLHTSASAGHLPIIQLLVSHGANVRCHNIHNKSAMEVAIDRGNIECARWLWLNQWSLSITKEMIGTGEKLNTEKRKSHKMHLTPTPVPEVYNINKSESNLHGVSSSLRQLYRHPENRKSNNLNRPQTAYVPRFKKQLRAEHANMPPRSYSARSYDTSTPNGSIEQPIFPSGKHKNKTQKIINYFISQKDRQQSIPSRFNTVDDSITKITGISLSPNAKLAEERRSTQILQTSAHATKLDSTNVEKGSEIDTVEKQYQESVDFGIPATSIKQPYNSNDGTSSEYPHQSRKNSYDVEKSYNTPPPTPNQHKNHFEVLPTANYDTFVENDYIKNGNAHAEGNNVVKISTTIPDQDYIPFDSHAEELDSLLELYKEQEQEDENISSYAKQLESLKPKSPTVSIGSTPKLKTKTMQPDEMNDHITLNSEENFDITRKEQDEHFPIMKSHEITKAATPQPVLRHTIADFRKGANDDKNPLSANERPERSSLFIKRPGNETTILKSSTTPKPATKQRVSFSSENYKITESTNDKEEKNKKAFEAWMFKKRKSISKQKDERAEVEARIEKLKAKRTSSLSMTFDEWLQMKKEETEVVSHEEHPHEQQDRVRKRSVKYQKTFDEWKVEKERSIKSDIEKRKSVEMEKKLKEEHEAEAREKEYNRKMEAWVKKKEQMKKNEQDRQKRLQQMEVEKATLEYEEWLSKSRVKTFEEWKKSKTQELKLNEVSKAQRKMIEEHEQEMEEMRQQIAKEKFQQWVFKKDIGKLKASEIELEKAKNRRKKRNSFKQIQEDIEE